MNGKEGHKNCPTTLAIEEMQIKAQLRKSYTLIHATAWMNLWGIILSEKSQPQQVTFGMFLFVITKLYKCKPD